MANTPVGKLWLMLPWVLLALGLPVLLWWTFEPVPLTIKYVSPAFLSRPAVDRADAANLYLTEAKGGSTVWRYVEYCVSRPFDATLHRAWVGKALVWQAPDIPTVLSRVPECSASNIAVEVPTSSPTRSFQFIQNMEIQMNPIRVERVEYTPIPLTIWATEDCRK